MASRRRVSIINFPRKEPSSNFKGQIFVVVSRWPYSGRESSVCGFKLYIQNWGPDYEALGSLFCWCGDFCTTISCLEHMPSHAVRRMRGHWFEDASATYWARTIWVSDLRGRC